MDTMKNEFISTNRKNTRRLALWTTAWLITLALVAFGTKFIWNYNCCNYIFSHLINVLYPK